MFHISLFDFVNYFKVYNIPTVTFTKGYMSTILQNNTVININKALLSFKL